MKVSLAIQHSSSVPLSDISFIFLVQWYKFRRQFWWYLAFCATMSSLFSCIKRSMSSGISVQDLKRKSSRNITTSCRSALTGTSLQKHLTSWCFNLILDGLDKYWVCLRKTISSLLSMSIFMCIFSALFNLVSLHLRLHVLWNHALLVLNAVLTPLPSSNRIKRKELGSNPSSMNLHRCPARILQLLPLFWHVFWDGVVSNFGVISWHVKHNHRPVTVAVQR